MKQQAMTISVLQQGLSIHGHMALDHGLTCLGLVDGGITASNGLLHIGPGGMVRGAVEGYHVVIDGTVEGDVTAAASLVVNGRVRGDISYAGTIRLGHHAVLEGKVSRVVALAAPADIKIVEPAEAPAAES